MTLTILVKSPRARKASRGVRLQRFSSPSLPLMRAQWSASGRRILALDDRLPLLASSAFSAM